MELIGRARTTCTATDKNRWLLSSDVPRDIADNQFTQRRKHFVNQSAFIHVDQRHRIIVVVLNSRLQ